jgi:hypothetical protein
MLFGTLLINSEAFSGLSRNQKALLLLTLIARFTNSILLIRGLKIDDCKDIRRKLFYTILGIILILVIAEIGCKDSDGKTPIDYARERSYNRDTKLIFR